MKKTKKLVWLYLCLAIVTVIGCNENINPVQPQAENNEGKKLPNLNTISDNNQIKIVLLGEAPYLKEIIKRQNSDVTDENFECYDGGNPIPIFLSLQERFGSLPENQWALVISPYPNFQSINNWLNDNLTEPKGFVLIMAYRRTGVYYPSNSLDIPNINKDLILIGAGENGTDWTKGNGVQFYKQSPIQYFNGSNPVTESIVDSLVQFGSQTKIYGQFPNWLYFKGIPIWLTLTNIYQQTTKTRYTVQDSIHHTGNASYLIVNSINFPNFQSGTFMVHWQSGSVAYFGADLYAVKKKLNCSYQESLARLKKTASNANKWNDSTGYGLPDIRKAVNLPWPPPSRQ